MSEITITDVFYFSGHRSLAIEFFEKLPTEIKFKEKVISILYLSYDGVIDEKLRRFKKFLAVKTPSICSILKKGKAYIYLNDDVNK